MATSSTFSSFVVSVSPLLSSIYTQVSKIPFEPLQTVSLAFQSAVYRTLTATPYKNKILQSISAFALAHFPSLETIGLSLNLGFVFLAVKKLVDILQAKYAFAFINLYLGGTTIVPALALMAITTAIAFGITYFIETLPSSSNKAQTSSCQISQPSMKKLWNQSLYIVQFVSNVALIFLTTNGIWLPINLLGLGYCFCQNHQIPNANTGNEKKVRPRISLPYTLNMQKELPVMEKTKNLNNKTEGNISPIPATVSYTIDLVAMDPSELPRDRKTEQVKECDLCYDSPVEVQYCKNGKHCYCSTCLTDYIQTNRETDFKQRTPIIQRTDDTYTLDACTLPTCPSCRALPTNLRNIKGEWKGQSINITVTSDSSDTN